MKLRAMKLPVRSFVGFREASKAKAPHPITTTMQPKGAKGGKRSPEKHRTRSDGLPLFIQQQIILDIEAFGSETTATKLAAKRDIYGEPNSSLHKSVKNKYHRLSHLKKSDPEEYWYVIVV